MDVDTNIYQSGEMYLHFEDGEFIDLTEGHTVVLAKKFWEDLSKLPAGIRDHEHFKTCVSCSRKEERGFCLGLQPVLPFIENFDKYASYNKVTAVFKKPDNRIYISDTTLQHALQYVANIALFGYCENLRKYQRYFRGLTPLLTSQETVCQIYLSVFWLHKGDAEKVKEVLTALRDDVASASKSQVQRLRLICQSDAFLNAYVRTHTYTEMLNSSMETLLEDYFKESD